MYCLEWLSGEIAVCNGCGDMTHISCFKICHYCTRVRPDFASIFPRTSIDSYPSFRIPFLVDPGNSSLSDIYIQEGNIGFLRKKGVESLFWNEF